MALIMDRFTRYGKCFFVPLVSFVYNIDNPVLCTFPPVGDTEHGKPPLRLSPAIGITQDDTKAAETTPAPSLFQSVGEDGYSAQ
ncbi:hypothetical protein HAT93_01355 [Dickeya solani]|nr:hypothetical protein [Dickeya solani]QKO15534.1 hypothetical protein HAT91_03961 [Dickeya solani]